MSETVEESATVEEAPVVEESATVEEAPVVEEKIEEAKEEPLEPTKSKAEDKWGNAPDSYTHLTLQPIYSV